MKTSNHQIRPLPSVWISHLPSKGLDEINDFSMAIRNSTILSSRLVDILEKKLDALNAQECKDGFYDSPSVSHKQAFNAGQRAVLREILQLFDFLKGA